MNDSKIKNLPITPSEKALANVSLTLFVMSIVGLLLAFLNENEYVVDAVLTPEQISVSDVVSLLSESLALLSLAGLLLLFRRALRRVGDYPYKSFHLKSVVSLVVSLCVFIVVGKLFVLTDWAAGGSFVIDFLSITSQIFIAVFGTTFLQLLFRSVRGRLHRLVLYVVYSVLTVILLSVAFFFLAVLPVPDWIFTLLVCVSLVSVLVGFFCLYAMLEQRHRHIELMGHPQDDE